MKAAQIEQLKEGLVKNLRLDFFEDEEISAILYEIDSFDRNIRRKILSLCLNLSSASSSLVQNALRKITAASKLLSLKELELWLEKAFELLDSQGIDPFMSFTSRTDEEALKTFRKKEGVFLKDIMPVLETYLRGISDRDIIAPYLKEQKIRHPDISHLFGIFKNKALAFDIYNILEAFRHNVFLSMELAGLAREEKKIKASIFEGRPELAALSEKTAFVEGLYQYFLCGKTKGRMPLLEDYLKMPEPDDIKKIIDALFYFYEKAGNLDGDYTPIKFFFGNIIPEKVSHRLKTQRLARRKKLEGIITKLINMPEFEFEEKPPAKSIKCDTPDPQNDYLLIKGRLIELDEEARDLMEEKEILGGVLVKGSEIGGGCSVTLTDLWEEEDIGARGTRSTDFRE
ncbi:MAG: hypothetical protein HY957_00920 [Nitrospirae bacterium]|nr:hypothetical protein [Nitrospirota bacterium]